MALAMLKLLACLACAALGRRVHSSMGELRSSPVEVSQAAPAETITQILGISRVTAAFRAHGLQAAHGSQVKDVASPSARERAVLMQSSGAGDASGRKPRKPPTPIEDVPRDPSSPKADSPIPKNQISPFMAFGQNVQPAALKRPYELWLDLREADMQDPARAITMNFWRVRGVTDAAEITLPADAKIWGVLYDEKSYKLSYSATSPRPIFMKTADGDILNVTEPKMAFEEPSFDDVPPADMEASGGEAVAGLKATGQQVDAELRYPTTEKELREAEVELKRIADEDPFKKCAIVLQNPPLDGLDGHESTVVWAMALTGLPEEALASVEDNLYSPGFKESKSYQQLVEDAAQDE